VQSARQLHQLFAQSLPCRRSRRACVRAYVHVVRWVETARDRCFICQRRQVYTRRPVSLTLKYMLVTILTTGCTHALVCAHFVYLYCPISPLHECASQMFLNTCMCGWEGIGSGVFFILAVVGACCWRGGLCFGRGRDRGFVLYVSLLLQVLGWWVGVCLYMREHTHRLLGYFM